jgi:hypothetical protein
VITRALRRLARRPASSPCAPCEGYGTVPGAEVFLRDPDCTCGAGDYDDLTFHDIACDTVPCPFCQLLPDKKLRTA